MHMSFEDFAKKLKTIPEYRLLTEQELRFHYNQARMMFPTPDSKETKDGNSQK